MNVIDIIREHSLTVRCLPKVVVSYWSYQEGAEDKKYVREDGSEIKAKRTVVVQEFDLEYFKRTKPSKYNTLSPEQRYENWKENFPNGRKLLREEREVEHGEWWLVQATPNTGSTVRFDRKSDFFAPTLEKAIQLYLDSIRELTPVDTVSPNKEISQEEAHAKLTAAAPEMMKFINHVAEICMTFGDLDSKESKEMFNLWKKAEAIQEKLKK
jgi:hypothetical protein